MERIIALKVLEHYRVWLRCNDGVEGEVDFSGKPHTGVFSPWQDYEFFQRARVGDCGELIWDDQIDIVDSRYFQFKERLRLFAFRGARSQRVREPVVRNGPSR